MHLISKEKIQISSEALEAARITANRYLIRMRRTSFKLPGKQQCLKGDTWGFTKFQRDQYEFLRDNNMLHKDGINALRFNAHGKLDQAPAAMRIERHELRKKCLESGLFHEGDI